MIDKFIAQVVEDCKWYADKYKCDLVTALADWEGDGPSGSWGLSLGEQLAAAKVMGIGEEFGENDDPYEY